MVDVALDDGVLVLDDDGDLGDLNDLDILCKTHKMNKSDDIWNWHSLSFTFKWQMCKIRTLVLTKFHHVAGWLVVKTGR